MKRLELRCRECRQQVVLDPEHVFLTHDRSHTKGTYVFRCPACDVSQRRSANGAAIRMLRVAGVVTEVHAGGPPLNEDDLLDLMNDLAADPPEADVDSDP